MGATDSDQAFRERWRRISGWRFNLILGRFANSQNNLDTPSSEGRIGTGLTLRAARACGARLPPSAKTGRSEPNS